MAKADGIVTRDEVTAFEAVFKVPKGEMKHVSRIFDLAMQAVVNRSKEPAHAGQVQGF